MKRFLLPLLLSLPAFALWSTCARMDLPTPPIRVGGPPPGVSAPEPPPLAQLTALGVRYRAWQNTTAKAGKAAKVAKVATIDGRVTCTVDEGVVVLRGATGLRYSKPPRVSAAFAVRLARFEALVQTEARAAFGRPVTRIDHLGTYVCRNVAGGTVASQHAFGNAIDVSGFVLQGGRRVSVARDFPRGGVPPTTAAQRFLARVVSGVHQQRIFGVVLTPDHDRRHATHLHLDSARRWWWFSS